MARTALLTPFRKKNQKTNNEQGHPPPPQKKKTSAQAALDFKAAQGRAGSHKGVFIWYISATNGFTQHRCEKNSAKSLSTYDTSTTASRAVPDSGAMPGRPRLLSMRCPLGKRQQHLCWCFKRHQKPLDYVLIPLSQEKGII